MSGRWAMTKRIGVCGREFLGFYAGGRREMLFDAKPGLLAGKVIPIHPLFMISWPWCW
jgi:hypothetical protein